MTNLVPHTADALDCIVIGYYEPPFREYETLVRQYGVQSTAYRDLRFSFVDIDGAPSNYVDLLNYAYDKSHPSRRADRAEAFLSGDIPNLAAVYLTAFLRARGFSSEYINLFAYEKDRLRDSLTQHPLCVAITTTFYVLNQPVIEIVNFIRACNPNVTIVVGGPLVANSFRNARSGALTPDGTHAVDEELVALTLEDLGADVFVVEGQGELTLTRIVDALKRGASLSAVPNIAFFDEGRLRITPVEAENNGLDDNTIPWHAFPPDRLGVTLQTRTARSCAFSCSFCNYPTRAGKLTLASLDAIKRELDSMRSLGQVRNVVFIDDTFNVPLARFKDICRLMIDEAYPFRWFSYFRCSNADEEAIELMARSGCTGVFLGIESGSPEILKNMSKAATIEKYASGIRMLREHGILTFASFIAGFPGETAGTIQETIDFMREHRPDYYRVQPWYCEAGTPIERQRAKYGIQGEGFGWSHATMTNTEAMDHIERMFTTIAESNWLPQWSFDFWIIPYLLGRGISLAELKDFMTDANRLLALEIAHVPAAEKAMRQRPVLRSMIDGAARWTVTDIAAREQATAAVRS
jgi:radical SAM PhpK family P-methyltransferase